MKKFFYLLTGGIMFMPLSIVVAGTELFYVQHIFVIILCLYLFLIKRKVSIRWINDIDKIYIIYILWVVLTFLFNAMFFFFSWDTDSEIRRIASLFMSLSLLSGYLAGRYLFYELDRNLKYIIAGMIGTYIFTTIYYFLILYRAGLFDLFAVRDLIGQRIPFIICFMTIISLTLAVFGRKLRFFLFSVTILGIIVILLSLTRAAYIQLMFGVLIIFYFASKKYLAYAIIFALLIISLANIGDFALPDSIGIGQITGRFEQLVNVQSQVEDDASGSFRVNMWKALISSLNEVPIRWLTGYGQLGASHVVRDIEFNMGVVEVSSAHSQYFDVLIREGLIGLILFIFIFYKMISFGFSKLNLLQKDVRPIVLAHSVALLGVFFYGFFHETVRYPIFGFYFWMYAGMISNLREKAFTAS